MARILLSALSARRGGGLTYLRNLVGAFPRGQGHRLSIASAAPIPDLPEHPDVDWVAVPQWTRRPIPRFLIGPIYFRWFWPRRHDFDLTYYVGGSFDMMLPTGIKTAVAFQNMLPFDTESRRRYPLGWIRFRHWLLEYAQSHAFRTADIVIFISEYARGVIDARLHRRGTAAVVPHGVTPTTTPLDPAIAGRLSDPFVLYLSILDVYKAQVELVEAWAAVRRRRITREKLVLAGPAGSPYADRVRATIRRHQLDDEVIILGEVPHDQVFDLAGRATVNAFMSSCENCPNIMLELMRVGQPMLISARQPMPELGGHGLDYVDPYDVDAVATTLIRLLDDPAHRDRVAAVARNRSQLFRWDEAGRRTWEAILAVAGHAGA